MKGWFRVRVLKENDYRTFERMCGLTQKALKRTMSTFLKSKYARVVETQDYIYAEGEIPIALVAHLDTVFDKPAPAHEIFYDRQKNVIWSPYGLGADDRAGVFAIATIIKTTGLRPHVIFTTDEEKGALGATVLSQIECPFKDLKYIIELDRRGANDCVFYDCENMEFIDYVEGFGFVEAIGSFSDISMICEGWGVAGVNLSIGYRDEHTYTEILSVGHMLQTIDKVITMLTVPVDKIPFFKYIPAQYPTDWWYKAYLNHDYDLTHCYMCSMENKNEDMIPVKLRDDTIKYFCVDCIVDKGISWCKVCGEAFERPENDMMGLCNDCKREIFSGKY